MNDFPAILADGGFPVSLIFFAAVFIIGAIANALGKAKTQTPPPPHQRDDIGGRPQRQHGERWRASQDARREELARRRAELERRRSAYDRAGPPPLPADRQSPANELGHWRQRLEDLARQHLPDLNTPPTVPPPMPKKRRSQKTRKPSAPPPLAQPARSVVQSASVKNASIEAAPAAPMVSRRNQQSETARNLRLLLKPAGMREAILLGDILGKPKSLSDPL